jgi:putative endonuclease
VSTDLRHRLGQLGETFAAQHLERRGFEIVQRNYRTRWGELDIVAFDGTTLVFCEVKTLRLRGGSGSPFESLRPRKQVQVRKMSGAWMIDHPEKRFAPFVRYDAIGVTIDTADRLVGLEHLEGAF